MTTDNIQAAIDAGITIAKPQAVGTSGRFYSVTVPEGGAHQLIDLEKAQEELRETPRRKRGTFAAYDAGSFTTYMSKHATEHSEVWADIKRRTITAVINAHGNVDAEPGWADHRLVLQLRHTPAWEAWTKYDRSPLPQADFAEHLEDWRSDVVEPTAADLTELSRTFKATKKVEFSESKLLDRAGPAQLQRGRRRQGRNQGRHRDPRDVQARPPAVRRLRPLRDRRPPPLRHLDRAAPPDLRPRPPGRGPARRLRRHPPRHRQRHQRAHLPGHHGLGLTHRLVRPGP